MSFSFFLMEVRYIGNHTEDELRRTLLSDNELHEQ